MLKELKEMIFGTTESENDNYEESEYKLQVATCALLIEVANADDKFLTGEKAKIIEIMKNLFNLEETVVGELMYLSRTAIQNSVSLYEFTDIINSNFSQEQKFEILKNIWRLILVDNHLDAHEDHLIKKIGGNLRFYNEQIIEAKLIVKEEMKR